MPNGIGSQNEILDRQFNASSGAGNQSEKEPSTLSHFLTLRSTYKELQEITPCLSRGRVVGGRAVVSAAKIGRYDLKKMNKVEGLLQKKRDEARGYAVLSAVKSGRDDRVEGLLQSGLISDNYRGRAFEDAVYYGYTDIVKLLLQSGQISDDYLGRAVCCASIQGYNDIIEILLQSGQISVEDRGDAVVRAARYGNVEVINMLLRNGAQISDDSRGTAVIAAAIGGHIHIIERLLEGGARIPQHLRDEAVYGLGQIGIICPALNNLVYENFPLDLRAAKEGINVHAGSRDDKTRSALELLWQHNSSLSREQIKQSYLDFLKFFDTLPESEEKSKAHRALMVEEKANGEDFGPLVGGEDFSIKRFWLTGEELVGRLWNFVSQCEEKEQLQAKTGMIKALANSFEDVFRVCNQGKTQRLLIAVLQGRLEGVQIDDLAPVLSPDQALDVFFSVKRRQHINEKEVLLAEANSFLQLNPSVVRDPFMAKLEEYWNLRDKAQEEAVQGGAAQEE